MLLNLRSDDFQPGRARLQKLAGALLGVALLAQIVRLVSEAQAGGVEMFAIGNEMSSLSGAQYRGYWTDLIAAVREVYHGELTYAAATDEAAHVSFWDQLDTPYLARLEHLAIHGHATEMRSRLAEAVGHEVVIADR